MLARLMDVMHIFRLLVVERSEVLRLQHLGEPDHGIEWGTQLVRHVREEVGFVLTHLLQFAIGVSQRLCLRLYFHFQLACIALQVLAHPVDFTPQRAELIGRPQR